MKAIKLLSSGKAPRSDAIPVEIYKAGGPPVAEKLIKLFHIMWRKEAINQEFKDATIIHLFKRKGNPQVCDNHRRISLLSIAGKILARVLLNRLNEHLEKSGLLHSFVEIDYEIFSTVILSLPLIQEGQLSVSGERMCTVLVNRLED